MVDRPPQPRSSGRHAAPEDRPPMSWRAVAAVAIPAAVVLLLSATRYGYFGDELYFLAAGRRPSWGYADQGPVLPLLSRFMDLIAPGSFFVLRLPSVLLTVLAIVLCAMLAREFGGGRWAQTLAALGYASSPFLLLQGTMLTTNAVDTALWVIITWLVVRWVRTRDDRLLLLAALVTAVDMQVKWLIPFFWIAVAVSSLIFGPRELVRRPLLWAGGVVVLLATIPELLWQAHNDWPQLEMGKVIGAEQDILGGRLLFVPMSVSLAGYLGALLLLWGLWVLLLWDSLRPYRFLGATLILLYVAFLVTGGRIYYAAGMYAVMIAAGAVGLVTTAERLQPIWRRTLIAATAVLALGATGFVLYATPWRSADSIQPYKDDAEAAINIGVYGSFGWHDLTDEVVRVYDALPPAEKDHAIILTDTYWQAAALDQMGRDELPPIYSPSRGFGYFGTPPDDATAVLAVGGYEAVLRTQFEHVDPVGKVNTRIGFPGNTQDVTIWKCTGRKQAWEQLWPKWMHL
ncbi:glycosyltransferase family 39 protein [Nocardia yamanashiensis]|uniref:glycosyltransferase family 39 protein n=1 Tax=Nocardia yamanashiensis TaxID=209247 RepID=UPI001E3A37D5|nr:glycosyltransferase family 39 protein [Nocardia yamanashiensis]UGT45677.1 glycosyltransferase family 39 protein [Nocardia yamanashiensis]